MPSDPDQGEEAAVGIGSAPCMQYHSYIPSLGCPDEACLGEVLEEVADAGCFRATPISLALKVQTTALSRDPLFAHLGLGRLFKRSKTASH